MPSLIILKARPHRTECHVVGAIAVAIAIWASPVSAQIQQPRYQPGWPCNGTVDPAYVTTAEATGGTVFLVGPSESAGKMAEMTASNRHPEVVFRASASPAADGLHEFDVPLDSTIESAYFFISLQCLEGLSIIDPSGEEVRADVPGVEVHSFAAIRLLTVAAPTPGLWKIRVAGHGFLSVIVKAKTDLRLANVTFADAQNALKRTAQRLEVTLEGAASDVAFHAASAGADVLKLLNLELEQQKDTYRTYGGAITPPGVHFRVVVAGTDPNGFRFQRVHKRLIVK